MPFNGEHFAEALREVLMGNGPKKEEEKEGEEEAITQIGQIICQQFGLLLGKFWRELRRLSALLVKCTRRDIGTAVLVGQLIETFYQIICTSFKLLFPSDLALDFLDQANKLASASSTKMRYFQSREFLRWMLASQMAIISDEKVLSPFYYSPLSTTHNLPLSGCLISGCNFRRAAWPIAAAHWARFWPFGRLGWPPHQQWGPFPL
jgi:hypothetical protein